MLPSVLAKQLQQGLADYIETTFPMTNPAFRGSLGRMLSTPDSVFHEPYTAVRLPFRTAENATEMFEAVHPSFAPYVHQQKAYERLCGNDGRSTLIATGTGSGKTECFLYPILEYCYQHRGERGIKALIIYPMNALASDQAKRIAGLIYNSPELRGNVTAGMFVGGFEHTPSRMMSETQVITDKETMRGAPPDILMTNYKMLDYLLVRPEDATLWEENGPEVLKYIAVDELHTFDGAQGTDLACLLRRLKARLFTPTGFLCCVGTSATMGAKDSSSGMKEYAQKVFGETFEEDSVITEDRLSADEFFAGHDATDYSVPDDETITALLNCIENDDEQGYLRTAAAGWLTSPPDNIDSIEARLALGQLLMNHSFTQSLLTLMADKYMQTSAICEALATKYPALAALYDASTAVDALFALISHARIGDAVHPRPFLNVQTQLWFRELRRLEAKVSADDITYALSTDLNDQQAKHYLPVVNCRDCGATGWVSMANERGNVTMGDLSTFYNLYFKADKKIRMLFPCSHEDIPYGMTAARLCPNCMQLQVGDGSHEECPSCGEKTIEIAIPLALNTSGSKDNKQYVCPCCGSRRGLSIIGLRSATAISVSISQMFASKFNDDKKALAFSDNVQDAAHRAGFFNSRTWRFGLRSSIQRYAQNGGNGQAFDDFTRGFMQYWRDALSTEDYVSRFIAPNMTWMKAYEDMTSSGHFGSGKLESKLLSDIDKRLGYELMLEFGVAGRIGRTLEKSGCSTLYFDTDDIAEIAAAVKERTVNELSALNDTSSTAFERMVLGFLNLMRMNGAFCDPAFEEFTINGGDSWLIDSGHLSWYPHRQSGRNTPRFICENTGGSRLFSFDTVNSPKYVNWIESCVDEFFIGREVFSAISSYIFAELTKRGYITSMPAGNGYSVWGLNKSRLRVTTGVTQLVCDTCGSVFAVASENAEIWEGAPCQRSKCGGHCSVDSEAPLGYYGKLYSSGDLVRTIAREHTGLLERDDREELEQVFKRSITEQMPWDTNVLSCTPTLEMGIDIGDLSSVIMCSIPPAQAQFLQRAGRAGRKDGNSLTLAVANARPHDLFFYEDPMEMISGAVEPPAVFLRASAVLERQFVAYCLDCWVKRGATKASIPDKLSTCLAKLETRTKDVFPFNYLAFVQSNLSSLLRTFLQMFSQYLDDDVRSELRQFAEGDRLKQSSMYMRIFECLEDQKKQKDAISKNIKQLGKLIKDLESKPQDSSYDAEIKELKMERIALGNVVRNINNKNVFNFLSDEGLLPNYAFPEAGIVLKAVLRRKLETEGGSPENTKKKYDRTVYEYSRSASSAISEFAPMNSFYVDGRKLTIDQVDLTTAQPELWRLCPNCSHAQREVHGQDVSSCPQCGSPAWSDSGQVRTMLKVQMVYSNDDYTRSLIYDESDDRASTFYCKQMLVDVDEEHDISKAFSMNNDEFTFGYEFVRKATMREINFGESDVVGEKLSIAGVDDIRRGFKICKYCGKIQPESGPPKHTFTCKAKNMPADSSDPFEECLFLYREFSTEAIRILVPATTMDSSNVRQESFTAAFMLGMRKYFGNVDHLRACISEVPVKDADYRKQYLVIYDSVPGGTGYLKQLLQHENALIEVFEKALEVLESCSCKDDPQKDGCYHCLYAYRQSQKIGQISRRVAIELLKTILSGKGNVEEIPCLSNIPVNSLFESELERRFVEALDRMRTDSRPITITKELVNNKEGYRLKIRDSIWEIEPQVYLDAAYDVAVPSRPDFIIWPIRGTGDQKPVAVFTDGFQYHKDIVADDTLKREAIRRSGRFRVFSLSWKDVESVFHVQNEYATATLLPQKMPSGAKVYQPTVMNGHAEALKPDAASPMELLIKYLELTDAENVFAVHARAYAISLLDMSMVGKAAAFAEWHRLVEPVLTSFTYFDDDYVLEDTIFGKWLPRQSNAYLKVLAGVGTTDMRTKKNDADYRVIAILNDSAEGRTDKYSEEWNGFWQFYNVMQYLPGFVAVSSTGIETGVYHALPITVDTDIETQPANTSTDAWTEVLVQLLDTSAKKMADKLIQLGIPAPSIVGFELTDESGEVIAEAEMAWEAQKIAFLLPEQSESKAFEEHDWLVLTADSEPTKELFDERSTL